MVGLDHKCQVLDFRVLDSGMRYKMWKFKNLKTFPLVFRITVKAGNLNIGKHMSNFGHRSLQENAN